MPCSLTPVRLLVPGHCGTGVLSPFDTTWTTPTTSAFRGSFTRPPTSLSTLRRRPCGIPTQDSLPAGGQPLPGRIWTCRVPSVRFQLCRRLSTSLPPSPGLPWRTVPDTSSLAPKRHPAPAGVEQDRPPAGARSRVADQALRRHPVSSVTRKGLPDLIHAAEERLGRERPFVKEYGGEPVEGVTAEAG
jgi:hypothetical protein